MPIRVRRPPGTRADSRMRAQRPSPLGFVPFPPALKLAGVHPQATGEGVPGETRHILEGVQPPREIIGYEPVLNDEMRWQETALHPTFSIMKRSSNMVTLSTRISRLRTSAEGHRFPSHQLGEVSRGHARKARHLVLGDVEPVHGLPDPVGVEPHPVCGSSPFHFLSPFFLPLRVLLEPRSEPPLAIACGASPVLRRHVSVQFGMIQAMAYNDARQNPEALQPQSVLFFGELSFHGNFLILVKSGVH